MPQGNNPALTADEQLLANAHWEQITELERQVFEREHVDMRKDHDFSYEAGKGYTLSGLLTMMFTSWMKRATIEYVNQENPTPESTLTLARKRAAGL